MITHKNVHVQNYTLGSQCAVTKEPRRLTMFYYCDEQAGIINLENDRQTYYSDGTPSGLAADESLRFVRQMGGILDLDFVQETLQIEKIKAQDKRKSAPYGWNLIEDKLMF